jgi:hypothetical protein
VDQTDQNRQADERAGQRGESHPGRDCGHRDTQHVERQPLAFFSPNYTLALIAPLPTNACAALAAATSFGSACE